MPVWLSKFIRVRIIQLVGFWTDSLLHSRLRGQPFVRRRSIMVDPLCVRKTLEWAWFVKRIDNKRPYAFDSLYSGLVSDVHCFSCRCKVALITHQNRRRDTVWLSYSWATMCVATNKSLNCNDHCHKQNMLDFNIIIARGKKAHTGRLTWRLPLY